MEIVKEVGWMNWVIIGSIIVGAALITRVIRWLINKSLLSSLEGSDIDYTRSRFFKNTISVVIWFIALAAIISLIPQLKSLAITLLASAGIFVAIVGLAAQQAFSNIISGIFIVISKPFRVGDVIKVGSQDYGIVEDITLRHTIITNFQNKRIVIPNALIGSEVIVNDSIEERKICKWVEIGISYDSDLDLAIAIIQKAAIAHKDQIDNRSISQKENNEPEVEVRLITFGDFSVNLRAYVWSIDPISAARMHSDLNKEIKIQFDKGGIEIPFPYRTVVYKKDLDAEKNT